MKKGFIFVLLGTVIFSFFIYFQYIRINENAEYFTYNQLENKSRKIDPEKSKVVLPEDLEERKDTMYYVNNYIIRGYFDDYNEANKKITLKAELLNRNQYRKIEANLNDDTIFSCWPETLYDPNSEKEILTHTLTFPLNNNYDFLKISQEKIIEDYDLSQLKNFNYLIIQLKNKVSTENENNIKKLIFLQKC